jgi:hypothetical protein
MRRKLAYLSGLTLALASWFAPAPPAGALTGTEKFIYAVYEDFLFVEPDADQLTWWTVYLGSSSRASMVSSLLNSSDFQGLWVIGASEYYLGQLDSTYDTVVSNLVSSDDFVASEVALVSGAEYFANAGSTNTGYVTALYQDVLLRNGSSGDISYWAGQITAGTRTRAWVANYFIRTTESANRRVGGTAGMTTCSATELSDIAAIAAGTYCIVLDRIAGSGEISYWAGQLTATDQLPALWASVAGSTEYYNAAQTRF